MKLHDLKPAPGSTQVKRREGSRHRRQGRQDRRPRQQGPGRAQHGVAPVRRWPDPDPPPHAEVEGIHEPVPGRVPRREPQDARDARRRVRGDRPRAFGSTASSPSEAWSRCSGRVSSPRHSRSARTGSRRRRSARSKPPAAPPTSFRLLGAIGARPPEGTHSPTASYTRRSRVDRRSSAPCLGSRACETCSVSLTSGTRSSSRSSSSRSFAIGSYVPVPYVDFHAILELKKGARHRRARIPRPLLGRRAHRRGRVRARDHAVHHVVDHHAVARRRDPEARRVAERRPDRAEEDHAVDPLPHGRARAHAVDRARVRVEERQGRPARPVVHAAARRARS